MSAVSFGVHPAGRSWVSVHMFAADIAAVERGGRLAPAPRDMYTFAHLRNGWGGEETRVAAVIKRVSPKQRVRQANHVHNKVDKLKGRMKRATRTSTQLFCFCFFLFLFLFFEL